MVDAKVSESATNAQGYKQIDPLRPSSPLAIPTSATWKGLTIEHHLQPPAECELCLPQHTVCILLSDCQTERRIDGGQLQHNQAESGETIVYPAASEKWVRWHHPSNPTPGKQQECTKVKSMLFQDGSLT